MRRIRVGSRGSMLAKIQTQSIIDQLAALEPVCTFELVIIRSTGDLFADRPLPECGVGAFTREIEQALLAGEIDLAVHSMKDMPICQPEGLSISAPPARRDCRDALILGSAQSLCTGMLIGTGSPRRTALLQLLYPMVEAIPIRGNIESRLRRVNTDLDGVILAAAGLERTGLTDRITQYLDPAVFVPAPAQGVLALEYQTGDDFLHRLLGRIAHEPTALTTQAERSFLRATGAGCHAPVGAWCRPENGRLRLTGLFGTIGGSVIRGELTGDDPQALGQALAEGLMEEYQGYENK